MSIEILKISYSNKSPNTYFIKDTTHFDIDYFKTELIDKFNTIYLDEIRIYLFSIEFNNIDEEVLFLLEYGSKYKFNEMTC